MNPDREGDTVLNKVEVECLIRVARLARDEIVERKFQLVDREMTHGDGHVREAALACENQIFLLSQAIAKLWRQLIG